MFLALIGLGVLIYALIFSLCTIFYDGDLQLMFYEKFGKSPSTLKGKVVLITGASSGIGEHTAYALAKNGVKLVLTARRNEKLIGVKNKCIEISNGILDNNDILVIPADITDFDFHETLFQRAHDHFGKVDILVNNAGRSQRAVWEKIELPVDRQMFDLNVFAVVNLSRVAVKYFIEKGCGHVAVVSSLAGALDVPFSATYNATKRAIHGYFNGLRLEKFGKNIDVTLLCPGPTFSNFLPESFTEKDNEKYNETQEATDNRMSTERCAYLIAVALANKTYESWIAIFPSLSITYLMVYFPNFSNWAIRVIGTSNLFKFRDGK
ncbi:hypothetical protein JTB14_013392 [Gonioctena quinquepunctata]|nr:hypothetical protein JTB14_013392 [Gonioctena quinquepunctata]